MFLACLYFLSWFSIKGPVQFMFAQSWLEIKHKTRNCEGQNWSSFIHKIFKKKFIKRKTVNLLIRKNELAGWKVSKKYLNALNFWKSASIYNMNMHE